MGGSEDGRIGERDIEGMKIRANEGRTGGKEGWCSESVYIYASSNYRS